MSRGLGDRERAILGHLQQRGEWDKAESIAMALNKGPANFPSRPLLVSVRRAIKTLTGKGMVRSGIRSTRYGGKQAHPTSQELVCWLPCQAMPDQLQGPILKGALVETAIIAALQKGFPWDDRMEASVFRNREGIPAQPGEVPFSWLKNTVGKAVKAPSWEIADTAMSKAVRRLVEKGVIEARGTKRGEKLCCIFVRLSPEVSVA